MAIHLLDVNVLVALAWPRHEHYDAAHNWFRTISSQGWATCPMTQCGFVRLSSNPKILRVTVSPASAIEVLRRMTSQPEHVFWPDDVPIHSPHFANKRLQGYRQVTDAYLIAICIERGGVFATFDAGAQSLAA